MEFLELNTEKQFNIKESTLELEKISHVELSAVSLKIFNSYNKFKNIRRKRKYSQVTKGDLWQARGFELMHLKTVWVWL